MKRKRLGYVIVIPSFGMCVLAVVILAGATSARSQDTTEAGVQVLTRGPIHEAFAMSSMTGAVAGVVIPKAPYEPIAELPPDQRPEGENVAWIPGYWSWDIDRGDYIWVSGVWRDIPPGRQWVPGYWAPVENGVQWISGFWGEVTQTEVTYLTAPPATLEVGPNSPAPGPDHNWTPGCWVWQQTGYNWQPGYWVAQRPDWVWTPSHYTWTPRGYVYVPAYWDYDITHRGVLFAPLYYEQPVYRRSGYYHSPSIIIDLAAAASFLFVQSRSHHYYYGDYYDHRYEARGFSPWYSRQSARHGGDPLYAHYRSRQLLQNPNWDTHIAEQYRYRRDHVEARPAQTMALQVNIINNQRPGAPENVHIGRRFSEVIQSRTLPLRFTPVKMEERKQIETRGRQVHKLQSERARIETAPRAKATPRTPNVKERPVRKQLPASPVAARSTENMKGARRPPPVPAAPKLQAPESKSGRVRPQPTATRGTPQSRRPSSKTIRTLPTQKRSVPQVQSRQNSAEPQGDRSARREVTRQEPSRQPVSRRQTKTPSRITRTKVNRSRESKAR